MTESGVVTTAGKPGYLYGYTIKVGTTLTLVEFRNGGVAGTIKWEDGWMGQTVAGNIFIPYTFAKPLVFSTDIYAVISGTGAELNIAYVEIS
jgi:hypothetical protein